MPDSYNHFPQIAAALRPACSQVVKKTALDAQANIQSFIRANGQIKTGNMINSVYTQPGENDLTMYFGVGAEYAVYQNYGTRYMAGRPFWEPAIARAQAGFEIAMDLIAQKMAEAGQ
ncbi:MAG TPA: hypothetical protein VHL10_00825 [Nitrososphaera sp.]|jgi:HK97 gp10 family phage protein|nr:hypothetical protein [Nitrososphaera sp.]